MSGDLNKTGKKTLFTIDVMPFLYRGYFVFLRNPRVTSTGITTSALIGFANGIVSILKDWKPTHAALAMDPSGPTFRHEAYPPYKAQREKMPEDLAANIPYALELAEALRLPVIRKEGFEADDVMGTLAVRAAASFTGSKTKVTLSCATEGALIRYTLNGNEPNSHSTKYTGPFYVTDGCTVKAYAVMADYLNSEVATFAIEKVWAIGDTMGKPDPDGTYEWDHAELAVDGVVKLRLDGDSGWAEASTEITGDGEHTVEWRYVKDDVESAGEDAAWVANYSWASAWTATRTTEVPVSYAWLTAHDPDVVDEYEAYEAAAKKTAANGWKVWECYVVGLDPQDAEGDFRITEFPMKADGTPDLENIAVDPPRAQWNVPEARAVVKGAATLSGEWKAVEGATAAERAAMRFFKVVVEVQ